MKRQADGDLLWGVIVETEAYSQEGPACHGYRRHTPSNETLFGHPGRFCVYVSYVIHHCMTVESWSCDEQPPQAGKHRERKLNQMHPKHRSQAHAIQHHRRNPDQQDGVHVDVGYNTL